MGEDVSTVSSDSQGFALMRTPELLNAAYEKSPAAEETREGLRYLRAALKNVDPAAYRGIARCPLSEDPLPEAGWAGQIEDVSSLERRDSKARERLRELLAGTSDIESYPRCLVPTEDHARELMRLVDSPDEYEIVHLSKARPGCSPASGRSDLGFDVGYWSSGDFSILCDCAIWPMWHGPDATALPDLSRVLEPLNKHSIFPDYASAAQFRSYYREQLWAEREFQPGDFCIIKIKHINLAR